MYNLYLTSKPHCNTFCILPHTGVLSLLLNNQAGLRDPDTNSGHQRDPSSVVVAGYWTTLCQLFVLYSWSIHGVGWDNIFDFWEDLFSAEKFAPKNMIFTDDKQIINNQ